MINPNATLCLAVMSGKGGVGKTNLALSIGYGLHRAGHPVMLMDCDLGLANLDVLLGLSPERNLQDLLQPQVQARDVVAAIEPGGLDFLPAASGVPELVEMDEDMHDVIQRKLMPHIGRYHFLILDLGAGINQTVLSFAAMAALRLVVVTPEPTSLTDSYALMKVLASQQGINDFNVVVNMAASPDEARQTYQRLQAACRKFLGFELGRMGAVRHDPAVAEAVRQQKPLLRFAPTTPAAKDMLQLARSVERWRKEHEQEIARNPILRNFPAPTGE